MLGMFIYSFNKHIYGHVPGNIPDIGESVMNKMVGSCLLGAYRLMKDISQRAFTDICRHHNRSPDGEGQVDMETINETTGKSCKIGKGLPDNVMIDLRWKYV